MVKVQKRSPKTLQQDSAKSTNSQIKKSMKKRNCVISKQSAFKKADTKSERNLVEQLSKKNVTKVKASMHQKNAGVKQGQEVNKKSVFAGQSNLAVVNNTQLNQQNEVKEKKKSNKTSTVAKSRQIVKEVPLDKAQKKKAAIKAFSNNQKKKRADSGIKNVRQSSALQFETVPFDEEKFKVIVNLENIKKIVHALNVLVEKEVTEKKSSIFSDYNYFLNVCSYKIPNCPKRMVKLNLKHSLVDASTDDVVIIVPDLQRGSKVDYEPTIQHYEDLFKEIGVTDLKIVPFNQLRNECTTFETKRKFASTYDYFLCDGRIVGHVVGFCGKHFQKPRTTFHAVRLDNPKTFKSDIEHALKRTSFKQLEKGNLISIPVGNNRFTINQLAENIQLVVEQLKSIFPGGYANIRNIHMKIDIKGTSSMPLYVNLAGAPLETPHVIGIREQRMLKLKKEANEILSKFSLSKTGDIVQLNKSQVKRKQQIREARISLSKETDGVLSEKDEIVPPFKKIRKENKKLKNVEEQSESNDENDEYSENVTEDDGDDDSLDTD